VKAEADAFEKLAAAIDALNEGNTNGHEG